MAGCEKDWVLLGTPDAAACSALLRLQFPPTHWVLCTVDDFTAEARGVAAAATLPTKAEAAISRDADGKDGGDGNLGGRRNLDEVRQRGTVRSALMQWKLKLILSL